MQQSRDPLFIRLRLKRVSSVSGTRKSFLIVSSEGGGAETSPLVRQSVSSQFPPPISSDCPPDGRRGDRGAGAGRVSVGGGGDDADVQEVVRVAEVFAEPLQRRLRQRLDAVDHHLVPPRLTWAEKEGGETARSVNGSSGKEKCERRAKALGRRRREETEGRKREREKRRK